MRFIREASIDVYAYVGCWDRCDTALKILLYRYEQESAEFVFRAIGIVVSLCLSEVPPCYAMGEVLVTVRASSNKHCGSNDRNHGEQQKAVRANPGGCVGVELRGIELGGRFSLVLLHSSNVKCGCDPSNDPLQSMRLSPFYMQFDDCSSKGCPVYGDTLPLGVVTVPVSFSD